MTYLRFETPEAKFIIAPIYHGPFAGRVTPQPADAFVLEGSFEKPSDFLDWLVKIRPYQRILEHAKRNSTPMFNVDIDPKIIAEKSLKFAAYTPFGVLFNLLTPIRNASTAEFGSLRKMLIGAHGAVRTAIPSPISSLRGAIAAERIVKQVIPAVRMDVGRKPTIFIVCGKNHAELEEFLKSNNSRRRFLARFTPLERFFEGMQVNTIHQLNVSEHGPQGEELKSIPSKLPNYRRRSFWKRIKARMKLIRRKGLK